MDWTGFPFCIFGYGCSENTVPPKVPFWNLDFPSIPASFKLNTDSLTAVINPETLFYVFISSVVSVFASCTLNFILNRKSAKKPRRSQSTGSLSHVSLESGDGNHRQVRFEGIQSQSNPPTFEDVHVTQRSLNQNQGHNQEQFSMLELGTMNWEQNFRRDSENSIRPALDTRVNTQNFSLLPQKPLSPSPDEIKNLIQEFKSGPSAQAPQFDANSTDWAMPRPWCPNQSLADSKSEPIPMCPENIYKLLRQLSPGSGFIVYQFPGAKTQLWEYPEGLKLETFLRMCNIPYEVSYTPCDSSGPWMSYDETGIFIGAQNCIELISQGFPDKVKDHLPNSSRKSAIWSIQVLLDSHLLKGISHWRDLMGGKNSATGFDQVSKMDITKMNGEEIMDTIRNDLVALSASLGNKSFFDGNTMTDLDCSAFAILAQLIWPDALSYPLSDLIEGFPALVSYCLRIRENLWSEWDRVLHETAVKVQNQIKNAKRFNPGTNFSTPPLKNLESTTPGSVQFSQSSNSGFLANSSNHDQPKCQG